MRLIYVALMALVTLAGCKKEEGCKNADPAGEDAAMNTFITAKGINATKNNRGMYYEILNSGSSSKPQLNSVVYVTYKGTLLDGTVFDEQTNPGRTGFVLNNLIEGWKLGIPLLGKGGSMKMVVPSSLGYGCNGGGDKIPPNTPLYFEISLADFF